MPDTGQYINILIKYCEILLGFKYWYYLIFELS